MIEVKGEIMDIWQKMFEKSKALYQPQEVSDFVYARHVVAAVEAEDGQIFTGFCMEGTCGVFHLCAERAALFNMYQKLVRLRSSVLSPFVTSHLMVDHLACLVELVENF